ncbi:MAG: FAD-dependent oxidoreductase [Candidatus Riflebacteria bacterium]|nr:FAD-dependent oxidoreductase [Candidatus Riflebacteria bacterium]
MGLLKKDAAKKPLKSLGRVTTGGHTSNLRPQRVEKLPPCIDACASGTKIREWIVTIAQREKLGLTEDAAFTKAWNILVDANPFPSVMGRVCPHPCEAKCNRHGKDGAVAINALERFIGDWALERQLPLPRVETDPKPESIGVIGAGPAGLSFGYQMARLGYPVTVYEKYKRPGGMLTYGIPPYRLPGGVLQKEIERILDLGIELKLGCVIGRDIKVEELKQKHTVLFLGIGAHKGKLMRVPGEKGPGVWAGTEYLNRVSQGETIDLGRSVAVVGGGDTAIDAARVARRSGADVTIFYRRTRTEMPAIDSEVEDAFKEGIKIEFLVAPVAIKRDGEKMTAMVLQRMGLGEPDESGRRRPVPIQGSEYDVPIDSVIAAVSQAPDWGPLEEINPEGKWIEADDGGKFADSVWTGGDVLNLGIASTAIYHGRRAAEMAHAELRGSPRPTHVAQPPISHERIKLDWYPPKGRGERSHRPVEEWLPKPLEEIYHGITREQFLEETARCFSCGQCFGCERCWMYCTPNAVAKVDIKETKPGHFYMFKLELCDGCKKCAEECPCGVLNMI